MNLPPFTPFSADRPHSSGPPPTSRGPDALGDVTAEEPTDVRQVRGKFAVEAAGVQHVTGRPRGLEHLEQDIGSLAGLQGDAEARARATMDA